MFKNVPIQRKLMTVILLTSGAVLLLTTSVYFVYEFLTYRQTTLRQLSTLGQIIAANSTAALAFESREEAGEILSALAAEPYIVVACLYDKDGKFFSLYAQDTSTVTLPEKPRFDGYRFEQSYLIGFQPVIHGNNRLGTLYLQSDNRAMYNRLKLYAVIVALLIGASFLTAYLISRKLQEVISKPILMLAETAKAISERHDYSVRVQKIGEDEVGVLTDAFNSMLTRIQEQNFILNKSNERLDNIVQSMGDTYLSVNSQWQYTFANDKALALMKKSKDEVMGKTIWEIFPRIKGSIFEREYHKVMNERVPSFFDAYYPSIDIWQEVRVYPHEAGIAIFCTDITKYKKAEDEIRMFNQKLEQTVMERTNELEIVNRELEAFSYSISHDLRAPLRSIHGYMNIFLEDYSGKFDEEAGKLANKVINNAKKMSLLIDDLLAFSKLGRKELIKAKVSMHRIVISVWEELRKMEESRRIDFILQELPEANADSVTIRQVWTNLIANALKYTRKKENSVIEIGADTKDDEVIYYIRDNGAGFDMKYYDKLFGVFQRLHTDNEFEGTGVGLAIVQRIIAKHGGRVWADAKPNEGATFYFSLINIGS